MLVRRDLRWSCCRRSRQASAIMSFLPQELWLRQSRDSNWKRNFGQNLGSLRVQWGTALDIETDHLLLVPLFGEIELNMLSPRIQRLHINPLLYKFKVLKLLTTGDSVASTTWMNLLRMLCSLLAQKLWPAHPWCDGASWCRNSGCNIWSVAAKCTGGESAWTSDGECTSLIFLYHCRFKNKLLLHISKCSSAIDQLPICDSWLLKGFAIPNRYFDHHFVLQSWHCTMSAL